MAKAFRGTAENTANNGGNVAVDISGISGLADGDLLICVGMAPTAAGTGSPGWSGLTNIDNGAVSGGAGRLYISSKIRSGDTSLTFTGDGAANSSVVALVHVFSGAEVDLTVSPTTATGSSTNPNPPAITPDENASGVVAVAGSRASDGASTTPTNYVDHNHAAALGDTDDSSIAIAWRDGRSSGVSENPAAFTSWSTGAWRAVTFVIKDAVAPAANRRRRVLMMAGYA